MCSATKNFQGDKVRKHLNMRLTTDIGNDEIEFRDSFK